MTLTPEALAEQRLAELITLNELGLVVSSTLDRDELIERALQAVTRHLRFDRALIMLVDPARNVLTDGRSIGGSSEMAARIAELELPVDLEDGLLSRIARSDGPLLFRDVDQDTDEANREFARLLEVSSFLGTPLVTKGRTVGVLAVDNRLTGRDVMPGDGPLLYTVGSLLAGGLENARLYAELEEQKGVLEQRVLERTADLVEARQAAEAATEAKSRFLSNVSHELRTPLTSVVGFSKLISKRLTDVGAQLREPPPLGLRDVEDVLVEIALANQGDRERADDRIGQKVARAEQELLADFRQQQLDFHVPHDVSREGDRELRVAQRGPSLRRQQVPRAGLPAFGSTEREGAVEREGASGSLQE